MDDKPDIEIGPLAAGCFSNIGVGCLWTVLAIAILSASGVEWEHMAPSDTPGWVKALGFLTGLGSEVLSGYVTARLARQAKRLHALLQGIIAMVIGVLAFVLPTRDPNLALSVLAWFLSIPLSLWGGSIAIGQEERR